MSKFDRIEVVALRWVRTVITLAAVWMALGFVQVPFAMAAGAVTDDNVAERLASAQTAADHEALAVYFRAEAAQAAAKVKLHEDMLKSHAKKVAGKSWRSWEMHCKGLIKGYKEAQKEAQGLAAEHERMAKEAGK